MKQSTILYSVIILRLLSVNPYKLNRVPNNKNTTHLNLTEVKHELNIKIKCFGLNLFIVIFMVVFRTVWILPTLETCFNMCCIAAKVVKTLRAL